MQLASPQCSCTSLPLYNGAIKSQNKVYRIITMHVCAPGGVTKKMKQKYANIPFAYVMRFCFDSFELELKVNISGTEYRVCVN